ncbi:DNA-binding response regulator [cyanobacterium TDX16]|nr:DNA-binding response regulator [cyanobacterium TDX16]
MLARSGQTKTLSILLVEDDQHFRAGLRTLLDLYRAEHGGSCTVVGEASSVETAISLTAQRHPDLMLLDMELEYGDGIAVLRQLQERQEQVKPLVLSAHQEDYWIYRAMQAGAMGYVFKPQLAQQLWNAIVTVLRGEVYLPAAVATRFFRQFQASHVTSTTPAETCQLSNREVEVLLWLVRGASNEAIAKQLYISIATVKAHLTSIFEKLQVTSRTQAIVTAMKLGLVQP